MADQKIEEKKTAAVKNMHTPLSKFYQRHEGMFSIFFKHLENVNKAFGKLIANGVRYKVSQLQELFGRIP